MAVSSYTTIAKIRSEIGQRGEREWKEDIGDGDGSETVFELGFVGIEKKSYVVSRDQLGTVTDADVDVYLNDSGTREADANYTLDKTEGTITFGSAPTDSFNIQCTYWHSLISDDEIEDECIVFAMDYIKQVCNQEFYTNSDTLSTETDTWDGDGVNVHFRVSMGRITAVNSYDVDDVTSGLTEGTNYWLKPKAHIVQFDSPPSKGVNNVSITYSYGTPINATVQELATVLASIKAISLLIGRTGLTGAKTGTGSKRSFKDSNRFVTQTKLLYERAEKLFKRVGLKIEVAFIA